MINSDSDNEEFDYQDNVQLSQKEQLEFLQKKLEAMSIGNIIDDDLLRSHTTKYHETEHTLMYTITRGTLTLYSDRKIYMKLLSSRDIQSFKKMLAFTDYSYIQSGNYSTRIYRITSSNDKPSSYLLDKPGFYLHLSSEPILYICATDADMETMKLLLYVIFTNLTFSVAKEGPVLSLPSSKTTISVKVTDVTTQMLTKYIQEEIYMDSSSGSSEVPYESSLFGEMQIYLPDHFPLRFGTNTKIPIKSRTAIMDNLRGMVAKLKLPKNKNTIIISKPSWKRQKHISFLNAAQLCSLERPAANTIELVNSLNPYPERQQHLWNFHYIDGDVDIKWDEDNWQSELLAYLESMKMSRASMKSEADYLEEKEDEYYDIMRTYAKRLSKYYHESTDEITVIIDNIVNSIENFVNTLDKELTEDQHVAYTIMLTNMLTKQVEMTSGEVLKDNNLDIGENE